MSNPNTAIQSKAVDDIHKIAKQAKMLVFMLTDEDLEMLDDNCDLTQKEKAQVWERMHDSFLDHYGEVLEQIVQEVKSER